MKLSYIFLGLLLAVIGIVANAGFRGDKSARPPLELFPDMNYQDKVKDQQPSAFFADGNSAREPVPGTVAMEMPAVDDYWATGKWDDLHWGNGIPTHEAVDGGRPLQIDDADMARGRERYTISCAPCHGDAGDGKGITSKYGLNGAASYHVDRLRQEPDGQLYDTIANGKGQMLGYAYNVSIDDRWRIVMYVRSLQRSQNAMLADASPEEQTQLDKTKKPPAPAAAPAPDAGAQPGGASTNAAPAAPQGGAPASTNAPAATPPASTMNYLPASADRLIVIKGVNGKLFESSQSDNVASMTVYPNTRIEKVSTQLASNSEGTYTNTIITTCSGVYRLESLSAK